MSDFIASINNSLEGTAVFTLGGLQPFAWICIYAALFLAIVVVIIALAVHSRGKGKYRPALLKKWQTQMPDSGQLLAFWPALSEEDKTAICSLCQQANWCEAYLKECGKKESAYNLLLALWPYLDKQQDALLKVMIEELASPYPEQSLAVSGLLKEIRDERVVPLLLVALLQSDRFLPARVSDALSAFGSVSGRALEALYHKVAPTDTEKKGLILDALGQLRQACPLEVLKQAMREPDWTLRKKAAEVIALVRPDQVVAFIHPLLHDDEGKVRAAAAAALSDIGGEEVVITLQKMAEADADWQVKTTCQAFLSRWSDYIQSSVAVDEADLWLKDRRAN